MMLEGDKVVGHPGWAVCGDIDARGKVPNFDVAEHATRIECVRIDRRLRCNTP